LLNSAYEGEARGRAVGIWAAAGAISAAIAPLIGGWLVDHVGWPSIFYINIPFAAASVAVALWKVPESKDRQKVPIDFPGAVLATLGLGALAYGLTLWSSHRSFSPLVGASIAAGIVILVVFMLIERRAGEKAMIPLRYFGDWCFSSLNLTTFLLYGTFGSCLLLLPYVLISAGGYSPVAAGMSLLPLSILMGLGSPLMGKLATRFGPRVPLTVGPLVVAAGFLLATRVASDQAYWTNVFPAVTLIALGMSILVAPLTSTVLVSVDPKHTGMVSGFNSALSRAGGLFGVSLLGAVLAENGKALLAPYSVAMIIGAVIAALSGLVSFIGLRRTAIGNQRKAAPT
jgi:MFS family permease